MAYILKKEDGGDGELDEDVLVGSDADLNGEIEKMLRKNTGDESLQIEYDRPAEADADAPLVRLENYQITEDEQAAAIRLFHHSVLFKRSVRNTVILGLLIAFVFIENLTSTTQSGWLWAAAGMCALMILFVWVNPVRIRKIYMKAFREIQDDRYNFTLYQDYLEISTVTDAVFVNGIRAEKKEPDEDFDEDFDEDEDDSETPNIEPRRIYFEDKSLDVTETSDIFLLLYQKSLLYVLPKRVMDSYTEKKLAEEFDVHLDEHYTLLN